MDTVTKVMEVTDDDIDKLIAQEVDREVVRETDWTAKRISEKYKKDKITLRKAREILKNVFDPLVEKGVYELIAIPNKSGKGGGVTNVYRRKG